MNRRTCTLSALVALLASMFSLAGSAHAAMLFDPPHDDGGGAAPEYAYFDLLAPTGLTTSWALNDYDCELAATCTPGALYVPTATGGQNIVGCKVPAGGVGCSGTCKYCSGGGIGDLCKKKTYSICNFTTLPPLVTCGTDILYNCVPAATPPANPSGQSLPTDNGCYCGTTPGTTTTSACTFSRCS